MFLLLCSPRGLVPVYDHRGWGHLFSKTEVPIPRGCRLFPGVGDPCFRDFRKKQEVEVDLLRFLGVTMDPVGRFCEMEQLKPDYGLNMFRRGIVVDLSVNGWWGWSGLMEDQREGIWMWWKSSILSERSMKRIGSNGGKRISQHPRFL